MGAQTLTWWCCGSVNVTRDGSDLALGMERGEALLSEYHFACHDLVLFRLLALGLAPFL